MVTACSDHPSMKTMGLRVWIVILFLLAATLTANHDLLDQLSLIEELPSALSLSPLSSSFEIVSTYYEGIMQELRGLGIHRATPSRLRAVGERLCTDANRLFAKAHASLALDGEQQQTADRYTHVTWSRWMTELSKRETTEADCLQFYRYYLLGWEPFFFHWPLIAKATPRLLQAMIDQNGTEWHTLWVNPTVSGSNYAANAAIPPLRLVD